MARLGVREVQVAANARKLAMVDSIALGLCWGQVRFDANATTLIRTGPMTATLDPWPLAVPRLTLETETWRLSGRFADAADMRLALTGAPREPLLFQLERG